MSGIQHIFHRLYDFKTAQKGSVAIYFALSLMAITTLIGVALDYGRAMNMRATLGAAADAAALATAHDPDISAENLQQRAEAFFLANTQNSTFGVNYTVKAKELPGSNGVHITINAQIDTTLMSLAGVNHFNISAESEAVYSSNKVELALVLDNTGSMSSGNKIKTLRTASYDLINQLLPNGNPSENVKIGIVPFDLGVKVGTQHKGVNWIKFASNGNGNGNTDDKKKKKKKKKKNGKDDDKDDDHNDDKDHGDDDGHDNGDNDHGDDNNHGDNDGHDNGDNDHGDNDHGDDNDHDNGDDHGDNDHGNDDGHDNGHDNGDNDHGNDDGDHNGNDDGDHNGDDDHGDDGDDDDGNGNDGESEGPEWKGCVGPRESNKDIDDSTATGFYKIPAIYDDQTSCELAAILPLTNDKSALNNKVSEMKPAGWTYVPEGLAWGWRVLSSPIPYDQGTTYADQDWKKVLVLMTDGENTVKWSWKDGWPKAKTNTTKTSGDQKTKALCRNIKDEGITIYTVAFQVNSSSTRNMLEDCASSTDHYFDAQNNSALEAAFAKIAGDINNLRLSK